MHLPAPQALIGFSRSGKYAFTLEAGVLGVYSYPGWKQVKRVWSFQRYGRRQFFDLQGARFFNGIGDEEMIIFFNVH